MILDFLPQWLARPFWALLMAACDDEWPGDTDATDEAAS